MKNLHQSAEAGTSQSFRWNRGAAGEPGWSCCSVFSLTSDGSGLKLVSASSDFSPTVISEQNRNVCLFPQLWLADGDQPLPSLVHLVSVPLGGLERTMMGSNRTERVLEWETQPVNQPVNHPVNQPVNHPVDQPINQLINQSTNQPVNQPVNQPTNQLIDQLTNHLTNQSTN